MKLGIDKGLSEKFDSFRNRLQKVYRHISKIAKRKGVTCYRVYDHDIPEFPLCIEFYHDLVYVAEYKRKHPLDEYLYNIWRAESEQIILDVLQVPKEKVFFKTRKKVVKRTDQYEKLDSQNEFVEVKENGLTFLVNLTDYLDTGLFLDHRDTRELVRNQSKGKKVLNLFCYTGSFSVYAASGGADEVVSIDMSRTYIQWTEKNLKANDLFSEKTISVQADVVQYIEKEKSNYYDIIILDPPTFSISKRMEDTLEIQRDYPMLVNHCLRCLAPGGVLYFSNNYSKFVLDESLIHSSSIRNITQETAPFDFERNLRRWCWEIKK